MPPTPSSSVKVPLLSAKVTVLVSVYNAGKTINKTLESITSQTLKPRVVCVNDASTDNTGEILGVWQKRMGNWLHIITNETNLGLTKSLNKGLSSCQTRYTARIDGDDWWEPEKLEKQVDFLESHTGYGLIGCWYTNYGHTVQSHQPPVTDALIRQTIIKRNPFAHSCVMFDTALIQRLGGYDETVRYGQDYDLWLRCLPETKMYNLPETLCHRAFTGGISIEKQRDQMRQTVKTQLKYIRKYHLAFPNYLAILEPLLVSMVPRWLADLKRKGSRGSRVS